VNTTNPYAPPRAAVSDVITEDEEIELASRGVRLGAHLLDTFIIPNVFVYVPLLIGAVIVPAKVGEFSPVAAILAAAGFVAWLWLTILYVSRNGQTIAKKMLNIKVVRSDGSRASVARIFWLRNFVNGLLNVTGVYVLIDPLFIFSDSKQCVHDKIADTIVVTA
jgi:uncharacterized RDD family membrane protein YckC